MVIGWGLGLVKFFATDWLSGKITRSCLVERPVSALWWIFKTTYFSALSCCIVYFQVFTGLPHRNDFITHVLKQPITARYVQIRPKSWNRHISMRAEFYGCVLSGRCCLCTIKITLYSLTSGTVFDVVLVTVFWHALFPAFVQLGIPVTPTPTPAGWKDHSMIKRPV